VVSQFGSQKSSRLAHGVEAEFTAGTARVARSNTLGDGDGFAPQSQENYLDYHFAGV